MPGSGDVVSAGGDDKIIFRYDAMSVSSMDGQGSGTVYAQIGLGDFLGIYVIVIYRIVILRVCLGIGSVFGKRYKYFVSRFYIDSGTGVAIDAGIF